MPFSFNTLQKLPAFIRLLIPLIAGIILQWYLHFNLITAFILFSLSFIIFVFFFGSKLNSIYYLRWLPGVAILAMMLSFGIALTWQQNICNNKFFFEKYNYDAVFITLQEPLLNKAATYKATASVDYVYINHQWRKSSGNIFIYFKKNDQLQNIGYGTQLVLHKKLLAVKSSGNPGAFDYERFCLFQQNVTHQVFPNKNDYILSSTNGGNAFRRFVFSARDYMLHTLQRYITDNSALPVAEALLIGYRNDLDKELLQAYSNTGVVHIIAISGMHIGFIYLMLMRFFTLFPDKRLTRYVRLITVLSVLWIFTLMAGAGPSIMRAAIMFSFVIIGKTIQRQTNIINSLAASAFLLLLVNPFNLWDVGFQLSYTAVLSIVLFYQPVYNLLYIKNPLLRTIWKLTAVTLAVQILTLPVVLFSFQQLPLLFLLTNLIAVPLSTAILIGELFLLCISWFTWLGVIAGKVISAAIVFMNGFILHIYAIPFSLWNGIKANALTVICLYAIVLFTAIWLSKISNKALFASLIFIIIILLDRDADVIRLHNQQKVIVYNISKTFAIDFINRNQVSYAGSRIIFTDHSLYNYNLKPCHNLNRINGDPTLLLPDISNKVLRYNKSTFLVITQPVNNTHSFPINVDNIIISGNASLHIQQLIKAIHCKQIIAASDNSFYKTERWKKECEQLHLRFHAVAQDGAFVIDF